MAKTYIKKETVTITKTEELSVVDSADTQSNDGLKDRAWKMCRRLFNFIF